MIEARLRYHPYKIFVYGLMAGLIFLFLSLAVSFLYTDFQNAFPEFELPLKFHLSTGIIILSSLILRNAERNLNDENAYKLRNRVGGVLILGFVFLMLQSAGWKEVSDYGVTMRNNQSGSFFFLLSGLHAFHLLIGLFFLLMLLTKMHQCSKNEVDHLIYFSDPVNKMSFRLTAFYWHFVDFLWIFLYLIFLFVVLI